MKRAVFALGLLLVVGCGAGALPTPRAVSALDGVMASDAYAQLAKLAPTEAAAIRDDHERAHAATKDDDGTSAELYAERAMARYQVAKLLAESALLERRRRDAEVGERAAAEPLKRLASDLSTHEARVRELELQLAVVADTTARKTVTATGAHAKARQQASASLAAEAGLLCSAARLLDADKAPALAEAEAKVAGVGNDFDKAIEARLACLRALEGARRALGKGPEVRDALLDDLSKAKTYTLKRDERGIVVTLSDTDATRGSELSGLGLVARGRAVQVVVHQATASAKGANERGERVVQALVGAGADKAKIALLTPGNALPIADPGSTAQARNERVEVVFVE